jgi:hypothetical protein
LPEGTSCPKHDVALAAKISSPADGFPPGPAPRWVTIATFADALAAEAPRIRLEAEGIPTFLEGERMGSVLMYHVATGGVKLQVPQPLSADARVLLAQSWAPPALDGDEALDDAWEELAPDPGATRRAIMRGMIVFFMLAPVLMALIALVLGH